MANFVDLGLDDALWDRALPVLRGLRRDLTREVLRELQADAAPEGLVFTASVSDREGDGEVAVLGVAGWRVMTTTYAGRKLHVDDLVVREDMRGAGVGSGLLEHLRQRARALSCSVVDLDSRVHRHDAHRFYLRERFDITAHHFSLEV